MIVFTCEAFIDMEHPPAYEVPAYLKKYGDDITGLGMTPEQFSREYSVAIKIAPTEIRGWE